MGRNDPAQVSNVRPVIPAVVADSPAPAVENPTTPPVPGTPLFDQLAWAKEQREARQFWIDLVVKVVHAAAIIASGIWAVVQYKDQQDQNRRQQLEQQAKEIKLRRDELDQKDQAAAAELAQRGRALRLRFYQEQWPVYVRACGAAGEIAGAKRFADVSDAVKRFRTLYYGEMCLIENQDVVNEMKGFLVTLTADEAGPDGVPSDALRNQAVALAAACRTSADLGAVFDLPMPIDSARSEPGPVRIRTADPLNPKEVRHDRQAARGRGALGRDGRHCRVDG